MENDNLLQAVINRVEYAVESEKIFLLGSLTNRLQCQNTFTDFPNDYESIIHYNLLILTNSISRPAHDLENMIENACKQTIPVTAIVMPIQKFNGLSLTNNLFARKVFYSDLLYDAGTADLIAPGLPGSTEGSVKKGLIFTKRASSFLASAQLLIDRKDFQLATFMLHQAFEQLCLAKIQSVMGIRPITHNLDKLYRYIRCFTLDLVNIFPRNNKAECMLFDILKKAYIKSRYSTLQQVQDKDLQILLDRLREFGKMRRTDARK
jgi:uncharacterized protein